MGTFNELLQDIRESSLNESDDVLMRRISRLAIDATPIKKATGWSYKIGEYVFGNKGSGQWQITKNGKEVEYLFGQKLDSITQKMMQYADK